MAEHNADIDRRMQRTVWNAGGCNSWYIDATGRNSTLWPGFTFQYRRAATAFDESAYELQPQIVREPESATV